VSVPATSNAWGEQGHTFPVHGPDPAHEKVVSFTRLTEMWIKYSRSPPHRELDKTHRAGGETETSGLRPQRTSRGSGYISPSG